MKEVYRDGFLQEYKGFNRKGQVKEFLDFTKKYKNTIGSFYIILYEDEKIMFEGYNTKIDGKWKIKSIDSLK